MIGKEKLYDLIREDRIEEALDACRDQFMSSPLDKEYIVLSSRYLHYRKQILTNTISIDESAVIRNQIISALLSIIQELSEYEKHKSGKDKEKDKKKKLKAFISYAHEDEKYRQELENWLVLLKRQGLLETWSDRQIQPGAIWANEISQNLEDSEIILLLVSQDFLASDYCYEIEMQRAITKHDRQESVLIPIILRHSSWTNSPVADFQALPSEGKPISAWHDKDEAWLKIYEGISNICKSFLDKKSNNNSNDHESRPSITYKLGILGETGGGKSSLCNSLIGKEVMRVSDIVPITRNVKSATFFSDSRYEIEILDYPGIGESVETDSKFEKMYEESLQNLDFVLWVIRSDVRSYRDSQVFIEKLMDESSKKGIDYIVILSMVDRLSGDDDMWAVKSSPGKGLVMNIERKVMYVSGLLRVPSEKICPISCYKDYNISLLKDTVMQHFNQKFNKNR